MDRRDDSLNHQTMKLADVYLVVTAGAMLAMTPGCMSSDGPDEYRGLRCDPAVCTVREPGLIDPAGERYQFVIDSVRFAENAGAATQNALDLDCAEPERNDNVIGQVLSTIHSQLDVDINAVTTDLVQNGLIIHLVEVQALALDQSSNVGLQMFVGTDLDGDPSDNFSGSEIFGIDRAFASQPMVGYIIDNQLEADLGRVPLQVLIPGSDEVFTMELEATMIEADITAERLTATLGGVLAEVQVQSGFLPAIYVGISGILEGECEGGCEPGSRGQLLLDIFDVDEDGAVTSEEFTENSLINALTAADADIRDESGAINPSCDGVPDGLSVAVELTGVPADIER